MNITFSLGQAVTVLILVFLIAFVWMVKGESVKRQEQIALTLSLLGAIAFVITVFDRRQNQIKDINNATHTLVFDELKNQQDNFIGLIEKFKNNYPESYELYDEMFNINTPGPNGIPNKPPNVDPLRKQIVEQMLSNSVFQTVENYMTIATLTLPMTNRQWMVRMLQWFTSPILQSNFKKYEQNYAPDVVDFINALITNANALQVDLHAGIPPTPALYQTYASNVSFVPRVIKKQ